MHNKTNEPNAWQGSLRYGFLNIQDMLNRCYNDFKSAEVDGNVFSIAITHLNEYQLNLSDVKFYLNCCNAKDKRLYLSKEEAITYCLQN